MLQLQLIDPKAHSAAFDLPLSFAPVDFLPVALNSNLNTNPFLVLPDDILRQILECAARSDRRTALGFAPLSRSIQPWIDEVIYAEVHLLFRRTAHLFLRTVQEHLLPQTSNKTTTKPREFFTNAVKSIFVCSDIEPEGLVTILSVCRGVGDVSYWPLPRSLSAWSVAARTRDPTNLNPNPDVPQSYFTTATRRMQTHPRTTANLKSFNLHSISRISPRRLSVLLLEDHPIDAFQPSFDVSFFSSVTQLSILNRWEEWTAWAGSVNGINEDTMPCLTYLKFDLVVGQAPPVAEAENGSRASRSRWLETVTDINPRASTNFEDVDMNQAGKKCPSSGCSDTSADSASRIAWTDKMDRISSALSAVLNNHAALRLCVLILRFEEEPARTAKIISRLASPKFNMQSNHSRSHSNHPIVENVIGHGKPTQNQRNGPASGFDPRLVFAWEKEPFRYSYAHSAHEGMIWKSAEAVANAQRYLSGYTVLNCNCLI